MSRLDLSALRRAPWRVGSESLILATSLFFALACNAAFWRIALADHAWATPQTWLHAAAVLVLLVALHALLLGLLLHRRLARPLLAVLIVATAVAVYFMQRFSVYLDPTMLRNVLRTDAKEARELLGWDMLPHLAAYAVLPLALLWRIELAARPWQRALLVRGAFLLVMAGAAMAALILSFQDMAALMRNHKEARYLVTPGNYLYSVGRVVATDRRAARGPSKPLGLDAVRGASWRNSDRPLAFVLVLGETARGANWGLNGYARQTTPELAGLQVINFPQVSACGTNTEVSMPCMFSPGGLHDYDEQRIRGSESLLHLLHRAGVPVLWRDNQSGCKGVCDGLPQDRLDASSDPRWCRAGLCLDEILLEGLAGRLRAEGSRFVVLHQLGNHGPAYFKRYPPPFRRFTPTCDTAELQRCSREEIVNAYDNALLYTDHFLARAIGELRALQATHDTALLYVSDHGESLGEANIYLHGIPRAIAPAVQTQVPMVLWMSPSFERRLGIDRGCLARRAAGSTSHDHLFHTMLGLLDVQASEYDAAFDLAAPCRSVRPSVAAY